MRFTRITVAPPGNTVVQSGAAGAPLTVMQRRRGTTIVLTSATTGPRGDVTPALQALVNEAAQSAADAAASAAEAASDHAYEHIQSTPSALWVVNHNLGFRPAVELVDTGGVEFIAEVVHMSVMQCVVQLVLPTAGKARCN